MTVFRSAEPILPYGILIVAGGADSPGALGALGDGTVATGGTTLAGSSVKAGNGTVLDPSEMANALAIATNVGSSFAAFEDDDRNGVEDHRR